jgi:flagellar basal body P-ring formation protein FlgA
MIHNHIKTAQPRIFPSAFIILLGALLSSSLLAADYQSHKSIMDAAVQHILDQSGDYPSTPEVIAGRLDSRLRLKKCGLPLESYTTQEQKRMGRITVGVRCTGATPWSLFVPVTVKVMAKIVVAKRGMTRGSIIGADDITTEQRDISKLHRGFIEEAKAVVGKKLRQRIRQNQVLTPYQLDDPVAIKRNTRVIIQASEESVRVRMAGKALQNGSLGQTIRVKNTSSDREIDAKVIAPGIVEVPM